MCIGGARVQLACVGTSVQRANMMDVHGFAFEFPCERTCIRLASHANAQFRIGPQIIGVQLYGASARDIYM